MSLAVNNLCFLSTQKVINDTVPTLSVTELSLCKSFKMPSPGSTNTLSHSISIRLLRVEQGQSCLWICTSTVTQFIINQCVGCSFHSQTGFNPPADGTYTGGPFRDLLQMVHAGGGVWVGRCWGGRTGPGAGGAADGGGAGGPVPERAGGRVAPVAHAAVSSAADRTLGRRCR